MCWVYILLCSDGSYYVGSTVDVALRLWQHQTGEAANYTRRRRPVELLWTADFPSKREAFAFERRVHGWRREKKEALIEGRWEDLPELSSRSWASLRARARGVRIRPASPPRATVEFRAWESVEPTSPARDDDPWAPQALRDGPSRQLPGQLPQGPEGARAPDSQTGP